MAANKIKIDASPATALALCDECGWRSPVFRTREKAQASGDAHRTHAHPDLEADAARKRAAA